MEPLNLETLWNEDIVAKRLRRLEIIDLLPKFKKKIRKYPLGYSMVKDVENENWGYAGGFAHGIKLRTKGAKRARRKSER